MLKRSLANRRKKILTLKEINISFIPYENLVFSLDFPETFHSYYNPSLQEIRQSHSRIIAEKIVTVCVALKEYPTVRYRSALKQNAELAQLVQEMLDSYKKDEPSMGENPEKVHSQLIIIDRGFDCMSPVLHELSFQAMAYDLHGTAVNDVNQLKPENAKTNKQEQMDVRNELWKELRHQHIADFLKNISERSKNIVSKVGDIQNATSSDLRQIVKINVPECMKEKHYVNTYSILAEKCLMDYNDYVCKIYEVEQYLVTGNESHNDHSNSLEKMLEDPKLSNNDKMRLIILHVLAKNGISEANLDKLIERAGLTSKEKQTIVDLNLLGQTSLTDVNNGNTPKRQKNSRKNRDKWTPFIKDLIEQCIENKLDKQQYPCLKNKTATEHHEINRTRYVGKWYDKNNKKKLPRIIIYVVGGISMSEMKCVYETAQKYVNHEIVIGSSEILTPENFLNNMSTLSS